MQTSAVRRENLVRHLARRGFQAAVLLAVVALALTSGPRSVAHVSAADILRAEIGARDAGLGLVADTTAILEWEMMAGLDYLTGKMTPALRNLDGRQVRIPGYIVPLEDFATEVTEFLLVPYVGACIHVPPPPPNQLVYVRMTDGRRAKMEWWNPVWIHGRLRITSVESVYGSVGFQLEGVRVEPYEF